MKKANALLLVAIGILVLVAGWYFLRDQQGARELESAALARQPEAERKASDVAAPIRDEHAAARTEADLPVSPSNPTTPPTQESPKVASGRVLDTSGSPLGNLTLTLHEPPQHEIAHSGADGRFEFQLPAAFEYSSALELLPGQRWTCACSAPVQSGRCTDLLVVAAPSIELGGIVEDENGLPVEGAKINLRISSQDLRDFPLALDHNSPLEISATSATAGSFHLSPVPAVAGCSLEASFGDFAAATLPLPMSTTLDLRIVLRAKFADKRLNLSGIVLSSEGEPVDAALVVLGSSTTRSALDGRFNISAPDHARVGKQIYAVKKGFQPAVADITERLQQNDTSPLILHLGPETLEIRGRVLLSDGTPAVDWAVSLVDGTEVSQGKFPPLMAEELAAGLKNSAEIPATDADGKFALRGLSARAYDVRAWEGGALLMLRAEGVPAGTHDLVMRVPADASWPEVQGTVVDRRGAPIPKVSVMLELTTMQSRSTMTSIASDAVETSADGSFRLTNVPRREVRLTVSGESVIQASFDVAKLHLENGLRLTVDLRCHFRLLCDRKGGVPDGANVLDANGVKLSIFTFENGGASYSPRAWIQGEGTTHAFAVGESGQTLVLFQGEKEIARLPLNLVPGQVTEVRY